MVSNEEIKRMLENRRRGVKTETKKESPTPVPPTTGREPVRPATQTCESCGADNPKDAKFCIKCGQTLKVTEKVEEKKVETAPVDTLPRSGMDGIDYKTCPNCSHQNKPQAKFCVVCGHKLEDVPPGESGTDSLLERVPAVSDKPAEEQPAVEDAPSVAELVDEESVQDETEKRSLLYRKVPEEESITTEEPIEEITEETAVDDASEEESPAEALLEEVPAVETTPEEAPADEAPEEEELPQVKTFKLGQGTVVAKEEPTAAEVAEEEVADDAAESSEPVSSEVDPMEKIKKAKELLDIGAISEEEFEEIKKKYLALI